LTRLAASILAVAIASLPGIAGAQAPLYKWIDAEGKTQYSDRLPKDYKGSFTRIEQDSPPPAAASVPKKAEAPRPAEAATGDRPADMNTQRREKRLALEANVTRARDNLEAARKALDDAASPQPDEMQVVRNRGDNKGGAQVGRSNCRQSIGRDGKPVVNCPGVVPAPEYYDRVAELEQNLRKAEEALATAQDAYRRGAD
jgi:hypothetical protein